MRKQKYRYALQYLFKIGKKIINKFLGSCFMYTLKSESIRFLEWDRLSNKYTK